jgi:hypothetical protein
MVRSTRELDVDVAGALGEAAGVDLSLWPGVGATELEQADRTDVAGGVVDQGVEQAGQQVGAHDAGAAHRVGDADAAILGDAVVAVEKLAACPRRRTRATRSPADPASRRPSARRSPRTVMGRRSAAAGPRGDAEAGPARVEAVVAHQLVDEIDLALEIGAVRGHHAAPGLRVVVVDAISRPARIARASAVGTRRRAASRRGPVAGRSCGGRALADGLGVGGDSGRRRARSMRFSSAQGGAAEAGAVVDAALVAVRGVGAEAVAAGAARMPAGANHAASSRSSVVVRGDHR